VAGAAQTPVVSYIKPQTKCEIYESNIADIRQKDSAFCFIYDLMIYIRTVFYVLHDVCHPKIRVFVSYFRHLFTKETRGRAAPVRIAPIPDGRGCSGSTQKMPDWRSIGG
jgi:hypothetical protein